MSAGRLSRPPHVTTPAAVITDKIKKFRLFKSKENIHKKEKKMGHTAVSAIKASSVTLYNLAKRARGKYYKNVAMHLQVLPQNTLLLWQLYNHKHIGSIPELLIVCHTIIVMTFK